MAWMLPAGSGCGGEREEVGAVGGREEMCEGGKRWEGGN